MGCVSVMVTCGGYVEEVSAVSNCKKYLSIIIHALDRLVDVLKHIYLKNIQFL